MILNKTYENITKTSYLLLAIFPLIKTNYNSILIILCFVLTFISFCFSNRNSFQKKNFWVLSSLFWIFLFHEIIFFDFNIDRILLHLPFLVFPLLFIIKPKYINSEIKDFSITVFQISVFLQCFFYTIFFLISNPLNKFFYIQNNIPFFREFVSENYFIKIHPTYFSAFLLVSLTISFFRLKKYKLINLINIVISLFFIFLFSSRIIFVILLIMAVLIFAYLTKNSSRKKITVSFFATIVILCFIIYPARNVISKRFIEIKTEINKPIIGEYYNSTNTRVAILNCSIFLIKGVPLFGYGDELQNKLNDCYKNTNDSDFYIKQTFNTHNYYINLILYGGWFFILLFLYYILYIFKKIKNNKLELFILIQFLLINLTENFLSRQHGIVLFTYFMAMFILIRENE